MTASIKDWRLFSYNYNKTSVDEIQLLTVEKRTSPVSALIKEGKFVVVSVKEEGWDRLNWSKGDAVVDADIDGEFYSGSMTHLVEKMRRNGLMVFLLRRVYPSSPISSFCSVVVSEQRDVAAIKHRSYDDSRQSRDWKSTKEGQEGLQFGADVTTWAYALSLDTLSVNMTGPFPRVMKIAVVPPEIYSLLPLHKRV